MSSDSGARGPAEQRDRERRPEPLGYLARQRERERERDADGRDDARDSRKRRSRSRSRSRSRGRHDREDGRYRKRSRDEVCFTQLVEGVLWEQGLRVLLQRRCMLRMSCIDSETVARKVPEVEKVAAWQEGGGTCILMGCPRAFYRPTLQPDFSSFSTCPISQSIDVSSPLMDGQTWPWFAGNTALQPKWAPLHASPFTPHSCAVLCCALTLSQGRSRRHSSDDDAELDLDPNVLLEGDALGLSNAEREAQEEARRLEESRKRRQAILAKHQQAAAVAAPTATAAAAAAADGGGLSEAPDAAAAQNGNGQQPTVEAADEQQQQLQKTAAPQQEHPPANGDGDASPPAATAAAAMDGAATPEGDRSSSDDSHNAPGTPVMDIWNSGLPSQQGAAGVDEVSSRPAGAPDAEELTSQLPVHLVVPGTEPNMQSERLRVAMPNAAAGGGVNAGAAAAAAAAAAGTAAAEETGGDDMFADDDDMFAEGGGEGGGGVQRNPVIPVGLMDNYDDPEGYYNFQVRIIICLPKGMRLLY